VLLPHSRREDGTLVFAQSSKTIIKELRDAGLPASFVEGKVKPEYRDERGIEWLGPTLWISAILLSSNPQIISVALNVISAYLYDVFKGRESENTAKLTVFVEKTKSKTSKRISYKGPVSGLDDLKRAINTACETDDDA
jgi:hypothetical protein